MVSISSLHARTWKNKDETLLQAEFSAKKVGKNLLQSVSVFALTLLALPTPSGAAEMGVYRDLQTGGAGRDGRAEVLSVGGSGITLSSAGQAASDVTFKTNDPAFPASPERIEIGRTGGKGGAGAATGFTWTPGSVGGRGGKIEVTVLPNMIGEGDQSQQVPLIKIFSQGGHGGDGQKTPGGGGDAETVTTTLSSQVEARGLSLLGVRVTSAGGAAGLGGTSDLDQLPLRRGGLGGTASLTLTNTADVATRGEKATAVVVESIGGAGSVVRNSAYDGAYVTPGGSGGLASFDNAGRIATTGAYAPGAIVQSLGGNGGVQQALGGGNPGGRGGDGGAVTATNSGHVETVGEYALGIVAQSVGGAGGKGGAANFGTGGLGGDAASGGSVRLGNSGSVTTSGKGAIALVAQSIGGGNALSALPLLALNATTGATGGGQGGTAFGFFFGSGGDAGKGASGGWAKIVNGGGTLSTEGAAAHGALVQSVGGSGGAGGNTRIAGALFSVALGGDGGSGGDGGVAEFSGEKGRIETRGAGARGVLVQSIGGGGGTGGEANSIAATPAFAASLAIGGSGGKGGRGGLASIDNSTTVTTAGLSATGLSALSIGGGGGVGGLSTAKAVATPMILPNGKPVPSIAVAAAIGGSAGNGGNGDFAKVFNTGHVETSGTSAIGLQALSIGGGGGIGGDAMAHALAIAPPGAMAIAATFSLGGTGGKGGNGGGAEVSNHGAVRTSGESAFGIQAESIGGGGGHGGGATAVSNSLSLYENITLNAAIGGGPQLEPQRDKEGRLQFDRNGALLMQVPVSDKDQAGGNGGRVKVDNRALIETRGAFAVGLQAQSVGGGGGTGGRATTLGGAGFSFDKTTNDLLQKLPLADNAALSMTIGGRGGRGGTGGDVEVGNDGTIRTYGSSGTGIQAQSIGGGGGTGGEAQGAAKGKFDLKVLLGGDGGMGNVGGAVTVVNDGRGQIETAGSGAHGISARSIGGGGGGGGSVTAYKTDMPDAVGDIWGRIKQSIGVKAYEDWASDKKNKENKDGLEQFLKDIKETEKYKHLAEAIKNSDFGKALQSYNKGVADYLKEQKDGSVKRSDYSGTLSAGGKGGQGNVGGTVSVSNYGLIATEGLLSYGIDAQSIGGGGGQGGLAFATAGNTNNLTATVGGDGGSGNVGGKVSVINRGTVRTADDLSYGLSAQSIGGGGGRGVGAMATGSAKKGADGKEDAGWTLNVTVGGTGGKGGHGGEVSVTNTGQVETAGVAAHGVVAQSIGGGGGAFVLPAAKSETVGADKKAASAKAEGETEGLATALLSALGIERIAKPAGDETAAAKSGSLTLGGSAGSAGNGGPVTVTQGGTVTTTGFGALGIFAQSIGGGGGTAEAAAGPGGHTYTIGYGGEGGSSGAGGAITVDVTRDARVTTAGDAATAVMLQSIGGGGGYGGAHQVMGYAVPFLLRDGASGDGGAITATIAEGAAIRTTGVQAHGIYAQSLGGGGGLVVHLSGLTSDAAAPPKGRTQSKGDGGAITITASGTVEALGKDANAIFAQSGVQRTDGSLDPGRAGGTIAITAKGVLTGGSGSGAAIRVDGGKMNTIAIDDRAVVSAASGRAIVGSFAHEHVVNRGTILGDIDLKGGGSQGGDRIDNGGPDAPNALLRTRPDGLISVASNGYVFNQGILDIGGVGRVARTTITGEFRQFGSGRLLIDIEPLAREGAMRSDLLTVEGRVLLNGTVQPNVIGGLLPGQYTFLTAQRIAAVGASSPETTIQSGSIPVSWAILQSGNSLALSPRANFVSPQGMTLTDDQKSAAQALQNAWNAGTIGQAGVFAQFLSVNSSGGYADALNEVSQESNQYALTSRALDARAGLKRAMSCPAFEGTSTLLQEGECVWGRITGARTSLFSSHDEGGYRQTAISYQGGLQTEFMPDWFFGLSGAYTRAVQSDADRITGNLSDAGDISAALKHQVGPWLFAASANLGYAWQTNARSISIGNTSGLARSKSEILTAAGRLRASYQFLFDDWYIKPYADLDVLHTFSPAYAETGAPGLDLDVRALNKTLLAFSPSVEIGGRVDLDAGRWIRPYGTLGVTLLSDDHFTGFASFRGSNGLGAFAIGSRIPDRLGEAGLGLQIGLGNGIELTGEYQAHIGDRFLSQTGTARMQMRF